MLTANVRGRSEETRSKVLSHRQPHMFAVSMIFWIRQLLKRVDWEVMVVNLFDDRHLVLLLSSSINLTDPGGRAV